MPTEFVLRIIYSAYETPAGLRRYIALAKKAGCDRVMLFNSRGHNEPAHLDREEMVRRGEVMKKAVAAFRAAGFGVGINNLATIGMNFSPPRKHRFPFQNLVDPDGRTYTETFCPLDEEFRDYLAFIYRVCASLGGDEVWVDDDFRYKSGTAQCFCPLHLAEFAKMMGREWTRETLAEALTSPTLLPTGTARQWDALQNHGLFLAAKAIARGAREGNPHIRLAFMGIICNVQLYGAEYQRRIADILSPEKPLLIRPEYGSYSDVDRASWSAYLPLWSSRRSFGDRYQPWPELETWPSTGYNHSRIVAQMKLAWGAVHGFTSSTINVSDNPEYFRILAKAKRQVAAIAETVEDPALTPRGVSVEMGENVTGLRTAPGYPSFQTLPCRLLARVGLPLWPDGGCGRIVCGNAPLVRAKELAGFAREGMILDRPAFDTLAAMGRDDILGSAASAPMGGIPVQERFLEDARNGEAAGKAMSMELAIPVRPLLQGFRLPDLLEFTALTQFMDADGMDLSAGVWTRAWAGGRIAVLPFSLNESASENAIMNRLRKAQLQALLAWLTGAPLPVTVEGAPDLQLVYRHAPGRIVLGLANFSLDAADRYKLTIPALAGAERVQARVLDSSARRHEATLPVKDGRLTLGGRFKVPAQEVRLIEFVPQGTVPAAALFSSNRALESGTVPDSPDGVRA